MQNRRPNRIRPGSKFRFRTGAGGSAPPPPPPPPADLRVYGNGIEIPHGAATTSVNDLTDFGSVTQGGTIEQRAFVLHNAGGSTLTVQSVTYPTGFNVPIPGGQEIPPNEIIGLTVQLLADSVGTKSGDIAITSTDPTPSPYTFRVSGVVQSSPPPPPPPPPPGEPGVVVAGNGVNIVLGDSSPSSVDHTDFGTTTQGGGDITRTFTVTNNGTADLTISGLVVPTGFTVAEGISGTIATSGSDTFQVTLEDTTAGTKSGDISFATNVTGKNPYTFAVSGVVSPPPPPPPPPPSSTPTVALSAPADAGTSTSVPVTVSATASANAPASSIAAVRFYANDVLIGTDTGSPYSISWSPSNATYTLKAVAEDDLGGTADSATRTHTIDVPPVTPGTTITSVTFMNSSGSATGSNYVPLPWGQAFKEGDIPSGYYPTADVGGTPVPLSWWGRTLHDDGSWRFCGLMVRLPTALANGDTVTVNISATNSAPSNCSVGLADVDAANIDVEAVGLVNASGTWIAECSSSGDVRDWSDTADGSGGGPVCKVYTIGAPFKQLGSDHASLYCFFHVFVIQNAAGGLYDIRVLPGVSQPFPNKPGDTVWEWVVFDSLRLRVDGVAVQSAQVPEASFTFTRSGATTYSKTSGFSPSSDRMHIAAVLTSSGTLPAGLVSGQVYGSHISTLPAVWSTYGPSHNNYGAVTMTDAGSGVHTATLKPWVGRNATIYVCPTTGEYVPCGVGSGASAADVRVHPKHNVSYFKTTRLIPPVETSKDTDVDSPLLAYCPGYAKSGFDNDEGRTGDSALEVRYGYVSSFAAQFLSQSQTLLRWQNLVIHNLYGGLRPIPWFDYTTKTPGKWMSGTYTGTGYSTVGKEFRWGYGASQMPTGFTFQYASQPTTAAKDEMLQRYGSSYLLYMDSSHANNVYASGYLFTGRPEMLMHMFQRANEFVMFFKGSQQIDFTLGATGVAYTGVGWVIAAQLREAAFFMRDLMVLWGVCPDAYPHRPLLDDWLEKHGDLLVSCHTYRNTFYDQFGWSPLMSCTASNMAPFTDMDATHTFSHWYIHVMTLWFMGLKWRSAYDPILATMQKYGKQFDDEDNIEQLASYGGAFKRHYYWNNGKSDWRIPASKEEIGQVFSANFTVDGATNTVTIQSLGVISALTNGDRIVFKDTGYQQRLGYAPGPGGSAGGVVYYIGSVSGTSFKLYTDAALTNVVDLNDGSLTINFTGGTPTHPSWGTNFWMKAGGGVIVRGSSSGAYGELVYSPDYGSGALVVQNTVGTFSAGEQFRVLMKGTARGGTTNTIQLAADAPPFDPFGLTYDGNVIRLVSGTGSGGSGVITSFNATTRTVTISGTWSSGTPDATTGYEIDSETVATIASVSSAVNLRFTGRFQAGLNTASYNDTPAVVQLDAIMNLTEHLGGTLEASNLRTRYDAWLTTVYGSVNAARDSYPKFRTARTGGW